MERYLFEKAICDLGLNDTIASKAYLQPLYRIMGEREAIRGLPPGKPPKMRLTKLATLLLAAEADVGAVAQERVSMYCTLPEEAQHPTTSDIKDSPSQSAKPSKGSKSTKRSPASRSPKRSTLLAQDGQTSDSRAVSAAAEAEDFAALVEANPERISTVRVVVIGKDCTMRTYLLRVRIAPTIMLPACPSTLQPVLQYLVRYYGEVVTATNTACGMAESGGPREGGDNRVASVASDTAAGAAAIAACDAEAGEYALGAERFVSCCLTLGIAGREIAGLSFAQVSRERTHALLGISATWATIAFCFIRVLSPFPLSRQPSHRWKYDPEAVLEMAITKLTPLQYNLSTTALISPRVSNETDVRASVLQDRKGAVRNEPCATHYLISGTLHSKRGKPVSDLRKRGHHIALSPAPARGCWGWARLRSAMHTLSLAKLCESSRYASVHVTCGAPEAPCSAEGLHGGALRAPHQRNNQHAIGSVEASGFAVGGDGGDGQVTAASPCNKMEASYTRSEPLHLNKGIHLGMVLHLGHPFDLHPTPPPRSARSHEVQQNRFRYQQRPRYQPRPEVEAQRTSNVDATAALNDDGIEKSQNHDDAMMEAPNRMALLQPRYMEVDSWAKQAFPVPRIGLKPHPPPRVLPSKPSLGEGKGAADQYVQHMSQVWHEVHAGMQTVDVATAFGRFGDIPPAKALSDLEQQRKTLIRSRHESGAHES